MSDTCWLEIEILNTSIPLFENVLGCSIEEAGTVIEWNPNSSKLEVHEANYGWYDELREAARLRVFFSGSHSAGSDYGPSLFCSSGDNVFHYIPCSYEFYPLIPIEENAEINQNTLNEYREFFEAKRIAEELCAREDSTLETSLYPDSSISVEKLNETFSK